MESGTTTDELTPESADAGRGRIDPVGLTLRFGLLLVALVAAGAVLAIFFREQTLVWSQRFVELLGGPGVFLGLLVPDAIPFPLSQDLVLTFGLLGGLGYWTTVVWGTAGSICGAVIAFFLGRRLATTRFYAALVAKLSVRPHEIVARYGVVGLALSTVTPIPFGACCWAVGALGMRLPVFLLVAQMRWFRVAGYLWLIERGFVGASGG